ncbi:MAG TPA: sigma-54 dependent transcriptional regulator, partial [Gemmatimonadaceae bacterium]|nr:sigma-54 dependent transcriptional regulator [Gemmatimonadaceae bacterium]
LSARLAQQTYETSVGLEGGVSYHGLWHILTRVKWLYQAGEIEAGLSLAMETIPLAQRMSDRNLLIRMKLIAAEGLGRTKRQLQGAALLSEAIGPHARAPLEIIAEAMRVTGRITAQVDPRASQDHYQRALHVFDTVGNITARDDVLRDSNESLGTRTHLRPEAHPEGSFARDDQDTVPRLPVASAVERIASLMQFAVLPPLIARELLTLVADTGAISHATLTVTDKYGQQKTRATFPDSGSTSAIDANPSAVRIALGSHDDCLLEIVALPLPTASARATLLSIEHLVEAAFAVASFRQLEREQATGWSDQTPEKQLGLICASDRMIELVKTIRRVADSNVTVLLTGETGVGKELFARALHQASSRSEKTFLPFNCSTVPRDMFDSQLFGHRRGSFTGAHEDSAGVIRAAAGGTLFLDEIGEMSLDVQPKLLRFLESGEVQPLGDPKPKFVDVRVVAATNANLDQLVGEGRFREDLFYRLNVIRINVPPLRERREEIPAMVEHFLEKFGRELQKPMLRIADETLEYLVLYRWPGNVRQLANEIRRLVAMAEPGSVLMPAHLSDEIASSRRTVPATAPQPRQSTEVVTRIDQPLSAAVEHIERAAIQRAVKLADGRLDDAAKMLGLSRKGLYLKRQRLNLE